MKGQEKQRQGQTSWFRGQRVLLETAGFLLGYTACFLGTLLAGSGASAWPLLSVGAAVAFAAGLGLRQRLPGACLLLVTTGLLILLASLVALGSEAGLRMLTASAAVALPALVVAFGSALHTARLGRSVRSTDDEAGLFRKLLEVLPVGVWVRSRSGERVFANRYWSAFLEDGSGRFKGPGGEALSLEATIADAAAPEENGGAAFGSFRRHPLELLDGAGQPHSLILLSTPIYIDPLEETGTLALLVDESAARVYKDQIEAGEERLRLAMASADMGYWERDLSSGSFVCDGNWSRITGLSGADREATVRLWLDRIHSEDRDRVRAAYVDFEERGEASLLLDYRLETSEGGPVWIHEQASVVQRGEDGCPQRLMGTVQDITRRKGIELELKRARDRAETANAAKGHFISTISHEIRTPLNAIIGLSAFLVESDLDEEQLDLAQTICHSGKNLLLMVNDLLDFSKIEAGRLELEAQEFPLCLCFEDCVKLFRVRAAEKNVTLDLELDDRLTEFALGDMERLRQVVQNLLSNALKFTEAGTVTLAVRPVELGDIPEPHRVDPARAVGFLDEGGFDYLEVRVTDSGIGIPAERQADLFEAFSQADSSTTRRYGGTGLGLAICKRLVRAMGGSIWLQSELERGSVFTFYIRTKFIETESAASGAVAVSTAGASELELAATHPADILLVGPKRPMERILLRIRNLGYSPHQTVASHLQAIGYLRRHYHVVFLWMEESAEAMQLARRIASGHFGKRPGSLVGLVPPEAKVSREQSRLSGVERLMDCPPAPGAIRQVLQDVLGGRD